MTASEYTARLAELAAMRAADVDETAKAWRAFRAGLTETWRALQAGK